MYRNLIMQYISEGVLYELLLFPLVSWRIAQDDLQSTCCCFRVFGSITFCIFVKLCGKGRPVQPKMGYQRYAADGLGGRRAGRVCKLRGMMCREGKHLYRTVLVLLCLALCSPLRCRISSAKVWFYVVHGRGVNLLCFFSTGPGMEFR